MCPPARSGRLAKGATALRETDLLSCVESVTQTLNGKGRITKTELIFGLSVIAVAAVVGASYLVDAEQTEDARLPDVDVTAEGGQLPEYDARVDDVAIVDRSVTVDVPEVEVTTREEEITVSMLNVQPPEEDTRSAESRENIPSQVVQ